jgi:hypothetical protein
MKKNTLLFMLAAVLTVVLLSLAGCSAIGITERGFMIGDRVWDDFDQDGIQDPEEPGVEGVRVFLYRQPDGEGKGVIAETRTNARGEYFFEVSEPDIINAEFLVEFEPPSGYSFTLMDQGNDDLKDSDADPASGFTIPFRFPIREADFITLDEWDAGLVFAFSPPSTPTPTPTATTPPVGGPEATPTTEDSPTVVITTSSGDCDITYAGPFEAQRGQPFITMFNVMCNGQPGTGKFFATLGDPPSDADATHANGELDAQGNITLTLDVNWPGDMTTLFCSFEGEVYPVTTIRLFN